MDHELQKLIRQLQDETCPPKVLDQVAQRISREKTTARSLRSSLAWAVSIACLLGAVALWQWQARREAQLLSAQLAAAQARANRALVVQQTQEAFGYIGQALIRAAVHTENTLLKEAVPPLRNGFETVRNKVTNPI
jgi:anti-sigma factor RsiW